MDGDPFYVGAGLGLSMTVLLLFFLPESIRYLGLRRPRSVDTGKVLSRITGIKYGPDAVFALEGEKPAGAPLAELFRHGRLVTSISLWIMFFAGGCTVFTLGQWMPSLLKIEGLPFSTAVEVGAVMGTAGTIGSLITTAVSTRVQRPIVLVCGQFFFAGAGLIGVGLAGSSEAAVYAAGVFTAFFLTAGWLLLYAVATTAYPEFMRATGLGMSTVAGRAGAVIGPLVVGKALASGFGPPSVFAGLGLVNLAVIAGGVLYLASRRSGDAPADHFEAAKA